MGFVACARDLLLSELSASRNARYVHLGSPMISLHPWCSAKGMRKRGFLGIHNSITHVLPYCFSFVSRSCFYWSYWLCRCSLTLSLLRITLVLPLSHFLRRWVYPQFASLSQHHLFSMLSFSLLYRRVALRTTVLLLYCTMNTVVRSFWCSLFACPLSRVVMGYPSSCRRAALGRYFIYLSEYVDCNAILTAYKINCDCISVTTVSKGQQLVSRCVRYSSFPAKARVTLKCIHWATGH